MFSFGCSFIPIGTEDSCISRPTAPDADPIHQGAAVAVFALFRALFSSYARPAFSACHRIGDLRWIARVYSSCRLDKHIRCGCWCRYFESLSLGLDGGIVGHLESDSGLFCHAEDHGTSLEDSPSGCNFRSVGRGRNRRNRRHLPRSTDDGVVLYHLAFSC